MERSDMIVMAFFAMIAALFLGGYFWPPLCLIMASLIFAMLMIVTLGGYINGRF